MRAMKFSEVSLEQAAEMLDSPDWVAEQKLDGTRVLAVVTRDGVLFTQDGVTAVAHTACTQHLPAIEPHLLDALQVMGLTKMVVDGELMIDTGEYHLFDFVMSEGSDTWGVFPNWGFNLRRNALTELGQVFAKNGPIFIVRSEATPQRKWALLDEVRVGEGEGIMLKHYAGTYQAGERVSSVVKVKFTKTADVVVTLVDRPDPKHGSFTFGVLAEGPVLPKDIVLLVDGMNYRIRPLGRCSAIGKPDAQVGDVIEVAYLYRGPGETGALVQPRMMRIREDKRPDGCRIDQFPRYSKAVR
jgi:ATP-dependent DNA ligase